MKVQTSCLYRTALGMESQSSCAHPAGCNANVIQSLTLEGMGRCSFCMTSVSKPEPMRTFCYALTLWLRYVSAKLSQRSDAKMVRVVLLL
eukprot:1503627-Amphidinium_carterae.1